jgi:hypothetical protein
VKYPYERFLRFLVSRKLRVNDTLARYGLPRAGDLWVAECRGGFRQSAPFALVNYIDTPNAELTLRDGVLEWAAEEKILPLWQMQPEFKGKPSAELDLAFRLFVNPFTRAVVGMLLMTKTTEVDMLAIVQDQFDVQVSPAALALYKQIFWDISNVGRKQWEVLVPLFETEEEKNYIAFGLQSPTANEVRDLLGMDCLPTDHKQILNQIVAKSYIQYKKAMEEPNPEDAGAMRWAELALKAIGTAKANGGFGATDDAPKTSADRFKGLFTVQPTKANHPTLADLAGEVGRKEPPKAESK